MVYRKAFQIVGGSSFSLPEWLYTDLNLDIPPNDSMNLWIRITTICGDRDPFVIKIQLDKKTLNFHKHHDDTILIYRKTLNELLQFKWPCGHPQRYRLGYAYHNPSGQPTARLASMIRELSNLESAQKFAFKIETLYTKWKFRIAKLSEEECTHFITRLLHVQEKSKTLTALAKLYSWWLAPHLSIAGIPNFSDFSSIIQLQKIDPGASIAVNRLIYDERFVDRLTIKSFRMLLTRAQYLSIQQITALVEQSRDKQDCQLLQEWALFSARDVDTSERIFLFEMAIEELVKQKCPLKDWLNQVWTKINYFSIGEMRGDWEVGPFSSYFRVLVRFIPNQLDALYITDVDKGNELGRSVSYSIRILQLLIGSKKSEEITLELQNVEVENVGCLFPTTDYFLFLIHFDPTTPLTDEMRKVIDILRLALQHLLKDPIGLIVRNGLHNLLALWLRTTPLSYSPEYLFLNLRNEIKDYQTLTVLLNEYRHVIPREEWVLTFNCGDKKRRLFEYIINLLYQHQELEPIDGVYTIDLPAELLDLEIKKAITILRALALVLFGVGFGDTKVSFTGIDLKDGISDSDLKYFFNFWLQSAARRKAIQSCCS
jgi:hypothetical protein